jgi:hypothetical protein
LKDGTATVIYLVHHVSVPTCHPQGASLSSRVHEN